MPKLFFLCLCFSLLLTSCGSMFDVTGRGAKDKKVFYDVKSNAVTCTYKKPMSSVYIRQRKNDSTLTYVEIRLDTPVNFITLPLPKDSIALYNSYIWIHLQDDHWRSIFHIDITKELLQKKQKIWSRFTDH
ncbi:hypothetical protein [Ferruginibacter sp. SUN106]|uniref:hypothetical protein n=1 Tax=Ferruginibacter sp. SUN106 TaxID=2978348 RepID=UPI003D35F837